MTEFADAISEEEREEIERAEKEARRAGTKYGAFING